ncbi:Uncharacterized protein HZ326_1485 [Fusarium oxysporum f. sp. albedinis]|nr:Uncharacterized protein HZ326_1485 [Fusarium oxysporum f. sp. albedinis]
MCSQRTLCHDESNVLPDLKDSLSHTLVLWNEASVENNVSREATFSCRLKESREIDTSLHWQYQNGHIAPLN